MRLKAIAPDVYVALQELKRTGWVMRGVAKPESVKEHTEALLALVTELTPLLSVEESDGLFEMLEVHDWPEAICGDEVILELDPDKRQALKEVKFQHELQAMKKLCADIPDGETLVSLWLRFENGGDPAARFARELDKYQAVEKALQYEEEQGIALFDEFLTYLINFIHHPVLLERIDMLKQRWKNVEQ